MKAEATLKLILDKMSEERIRQIVREELDKMKEEVDEITRQRIAAQILHTVKSESSDIRESLGLKVRMLGLPNRAKNCLLAADVMTLSDIASLSERYFRNLQHCGPNSMQFIRRALMAHNLDFDTNVRQYGFTPHKDSEYYDM